MPEASACRCPFLKIRTGFRSWCSVSFLVVCSHGDTVAPTTGVFCVCQELTEHPSQQHPWARG